MAKRTLVLNIGTAAPVTIYEDGKIVGIIQPGKTKALPLSGRLTIEARCDSEDDTFLMITTERRCACGDPYIPPYGKAIQPIGGDII